MTTAATATAATDRPTASHATLRRGTGAASPTGTAARDRTRPTAAPVAPATTSSPMVDARIAPTMVRSTATYDGDQAGASRRPGRADPGGPAGGGALGGWA